MSDSETEKVVSERRRWRQGLAPTCYSPQCMVTPRPRPSGLGAVPLGGARRAPGPQPRFTCWGLRSFAQTQSCQVSIHGSCLPSIPAHHPRKRQRVRGHHRWKDEAKSMCFLRTWLPPLCLLTDPCPAWAHPAGTGRCCCTAGAGHPGPRLGRRRPPAGRWRGGPAGSPQR